MIRLTFFDATFSDRHKNSSVFHFCKLHMPSMVVWHLRHHNLKDLQSTSSRAVSRGIIEAATRGVLLKKVFLHFSQNSQENTCGRVSFFNKVAGLRSTTLLKKSLWHRCFSVNFAKFLGTPLLQNNSGWLLLEWTSFNFQAGGASLLTLFILRKTEKRRIIAVENIQRTPLKCFFLLILSYGMVMKCIRFQNSKRGEKKTIQRSVVWSFSTVCSNLLLYCPSSLRNHSLYLIPYLELWNLSPTLQVRSLAGGRGDRLIQIKEQVY